VSNSGARVRNLSKTLVSDRSETEKKVTSEEGDLKYTVCTVLFYCILYALHSGRQAWIWRRTGDVSQTLWYIHLRARNL